MASGWAKDGAVQDQIDATVEDAVRRARAQLEGRAGREECEECGNPIPEARRQAVPGARLCIACQEVADIANGDHTGYNRRGSKDSQLR